MNHAVLVLGAEGSGTRLLTRLMIRAGCEGSDQHNQPFDEGFPLLSPNPWVRDGVRPIVYRRSFPHGGDASTPHGILRHWPSIGEMATSLRSMGYSPSALVLHRDFFANMRSQVKSKVARSDQQAADQIREAYQRIYAGIAEAQLQFTPIIYGVLVNRPIPTLDLLVKQYGLAMPDTSDIYDGNDKYYRENPYMGRPL